MDDTYLSSRTQSSRDRQVRKISTVQRSSQCLEANGRWVGVGTFFLPKKIPTILDGIFFLERWRIFDGDLLVYHIVIWDHVLSGVFFSSCSCALDKVFKWQLFFNWKSFGWGNLDCDNKIGPYIPIVRKQGYNSTYRGYNSSYPFIKLLSGL